MVPSCSILFCSTLHGSQAAYFIHGKIANCEFLPADLILAILVPCPEHGGGGGVSEIVLS
jgi:hypothetical protein